MKKILLTFALLAAIVTSAQDGYNLPEQTYKDIKAKVSQLSESSARSFADGIANSAPTQYVWYKTKKGDKYVRYYYSRTDLSEKEQKDQEDFGCSKCFIVDFILYPQGLQFDQVNGSFEDLFPTWQREFLNSATKANFNESFKYRDVNNRKVGTDIRFARAGGLWQIYNWSL